MVINLISNSCQSDLKQASLRGWEMCVSEGGVCLGGSEELEKYNRIWEGGALEKH